MTTAELHHRSITGYSLARGALSAHAFRGLFGFGVASIALLQAIASLTSAHFTTTEQVSFGFAGGFLGAFLGAIVSAASDDRE